jgi:hypothetical protein
VNQAYYLKTLILCNKNVSGIESASLGATLLSFDKSSDQLWFSGHEGNINEKYTIIFKGIHHERC